MRTEQKTAQENLRALYHNLKSTLKHEKKKLKKQHSELKEAQEHTWYSQVADSLLASPQSAPRGSKSVAITNIHTQKVETVQLNPKFDARKNAELLYKKARKGRRGYLISEKKVQQTEGTIQGIEKVLENIKGILCDDFILNAFTDSEFEQIESNAKPYISQKNADSTQKAPNGKHLPFRRFICEGWEIFLGKNSKDNDDLSTRFAKPSDIWLHVAGHAGSHVIIRRPKNTPPPPKAIIEKAASLAVWYSKAKHTSFAEVHVTEARFVRKRRHAPPGEVIAERCKSVRVEPKKPAELFPSSEFDDIE
ncbi:NFACT RNA binding domain-containing protein [Chitinispirillales bacterium ANBcel5]|uniref:NFACT RNA binding domain-containing protein n=1 Tax=Cellulosispirillum alkaliphilum TaxID=3039283 RepID=UPI002A55E762|nr:NFACT RNA binding domain-containing protein [Chitinispirillales bacterium ANBcel5]